MKRPILIIAGGVVAIAFLLLVNEKWIQKDSAPKIAVKQQEKHSPNSADNNPPKAATKPSIKHPVYDLSNKAHWYDPETTKTREGDFLLSELMKPFHPKPQEFQFIAQHENSLKMLRESLSEDEYYSVEGRKL